MSDWKQTTLGELEREVGGVIQTGPFGSQLHMSDYSDTGTPVVMPTNIRNLRIDSSGIARVGDEHVERLGRHRLQAGDIVYSRRGDVEKCALITDREEGWLCGTGCLLVRVGSADFSARFISYALSQPETRSWISQHAVGATMPNLNTGILREVPIRIPNPATQRAIAATLGALDDKIESNRRQRHLLRELGLAEYQASIRDGSRSLQLSAATVSIARGVAPKYADEDLDAALVINQKCIRDGWVSLAPARRMHDRTVKPEKRASAGDILVNSTGTGTLGRIARWHAGESFVDGHVSVVKADRSVISPTVLAYSLLGREADIEGLATGSTGQTELSAARLGELNVILPPTEQGSRLETTLIAIENRCDQLAAENTNLESTRDALLPALLSGSIRVPAEGVKA